MWSYAGLGEGGSKESSREKSEYFYYILTDFLPNN